MSCWEWAMAEGVKKSFRMLLINQIYNFLCFKNVFLNKNEFVNFMKKRITKDNVYYSENRKISVNKLTKQSKTWDSVKKAIEEYEELFDINLPIGSGVFYRIYETTCQSVEEETHQAMEAAIYNLNTLHSRCGSQIPFSSINYGLDTSDEGRLIIKETLLVTEEGLGNGETPIFPIQVFLLKEGVNYNPGDPNYDLFKLSLKVSAKRLFPNYTSVDASFNLPYYKEGDYKTFPVTMG